MTASQGDVSEHATGGEARSHDGFPLRAWLLWVGLLTILAAYCAVVLHLHPANLFGLTEDDTIYFTSAREIAAGHGYVLPNVPGRPAATKYPILYPWLLSLVWRWNPAFPGNLSTAVWLNLFFGCAFAVATFAFLRRAAGAGVWASLVLTAFCAFTQDTIFSSALIMSDIPFAALALAACLGASLPKTEERRWTLVAAGILVGLATLTRTMGAPIALGLCVGVWLRGGWRKAAEFGAGFLPCAAFLAWKSLTIVPAALPSGATPLCAHSWRMTWLYYTDYVGFWKADTLAAHTLRPLLETNAFLTLLQPGAYVLSSASVVSSPVAFTVVLGIASAVVLRGMARQIRERGLLPVHIALPLYVLPLLVWNYRDPGRFFLPFLPLFASGLWAELQHVIGMMRRSMKRGRTDDRVATAFLFLVGLMLMALGAASWLDQRRFLAKLSDSRAALIGEKKQGYLWLEQNADAPILAYEDGLAFLYSGRLAMRPTIFSPAGAERAQILNAELSCIASSGPAIGARYWLMADDDFGYEWKPARSRGLAREKEIGKTLTEAFVSENGRVRIYKLAPQELTKQDDPPGK
jgi:hypothetical protein